MEWILAYYFGDPVDTDWYYSAWITPFAEDAVVAWRGNNKSKLQAPQVKPGVSQNVPEMKTDQRVREGLQVTELEQLALVMPKRDMTLIGFPALRGFGDSVWFDMPAETKWCEFMKWAEWERYPKIACPLHSDLLAWKQSD
jgi:hypothetical protein